MCCKINRSIGLGRVFTQVRGKLIECWQIIDYGDCLLNLVNTNTPPIS